MDDDSNQSATSHAEQGSDMSGTTTGSGDSVDGTWESVGTSQESARSVTTALNHDLASTTTEDDARPRRAP